MIKYTEKPSIEKHIDSKQCDICKKDYDDDFEMQEFLHVDFYGGYGSVFGDGDNVRCDICQHCLKRLLKPEWLQPPRLGILSTSSVSTTAVVYVDGGVSTI